MLTKRLPISVRRRFWRMRKRLALRPLVGWVDFGSFRRTKPISTHFGYDRGQPIDRYYMEAFLEQHRADIQGHVLEVEDDGYTRRFGGNRVQQSSILHVQPDHPQATIVGNLETGTGIPERTYDCIILTQTLQFIYDPAAAVNSACRALKPGGVLLATMPCISQISRYDMDRWGEYWRFTSRSADQLFKAAFPADAISITAYGSVYSAVALLYGLAVEDVSAEKLHFHDPDFEVLVAVRAVKPG